MKLIDADELNRVNEESIAEYSEYYTGDMIHGMRSVCQYAVEHAPTVDAGPVEYILKQIVKLERSKGQSYHAICYRHLIEVWEMENERKEE